LRATEAALYNKDLTQCVQACEIPNNKSLYYILFVAFQYIVNLPAIESGMPTVYLLINGAMVLIVTLFHATFL